MDLVRGARRAVSDRWSSPSSRQATQQLLKMPQSQPMQRSIELLPYTNTEYTRSPSSDDEFSSSSTVCIDPTLSSSGSASPSPYAGIEGLHSPLEVNDKRLLGMSHLPRLPRVSHEIGVAEMLAESITFQDSEEKFFTPSLGIDDEGTNDYYEYDSEEEYTVLSTWCIIKRASLPIDTFCRIPAPPCNRNNHKDARKEWDCYTHC